MWVFLLFLIFIIYTYFGYPLVLLVLGKMVKPRRDIQPSGGEAPSISVLIPVYNEEAVIVQKLENTLGLDYPRDKLEIVVASDGSTDRTAELVQPYLDKGVILFDYPENRGKMSVINRTMPKLSGELVVFTDASAIFRNDALSFLASGFRHEKVGAVSGALILKEEEGPQGELSVDLYWRLEKLVREWESRLYSCVSATGAIYALRRSLFQPLPEDTILDDMLIPLMPVRSGYRILFESRALAFEDGYTNLKLEFRRKVRTLVGNYQVFFRASWAILPWKSRISFLLISHKLLRLLVPLALFGVFFSCLFGPVYLIPILVIQIIFYCLAWYGLFANRRGDQPGKLFTVPMTFCLLNTAALRAFVVYFFQNKNPIWK